MTSYEKAELLKDTIEQLYSKEGRSISYISKLLKINRKTVSTKIKKEWCLKEAEPRRHLNPSTKKFIRNNRTQIKSLLDKNTSISDIARILNVKRDFLQKTVIPNDEVLNKARNDYINRLKNRHNQIVEEKTASSKLEYIPNETPGEIWKDILGYPGYMVSDLGRIKKYKKRYDKYSLIKPAPNVKSKRLYVALRNAKGEVKNLQLARIVAHAFVENTNPETNTTVNHEDGDLSNCKASNLTWMSQKNNSLHAHRVLGKANEPMKKIKFEKLIYKNKYEFKTIAALARFIGKSKTQTRRYLDEPEKHDIKIIGMIVTTRKNVGEPYKIAD